MKSLSFTLHIERDGPAYRFLIDVDAVTLFRKDQLPRRRPLAMSYGAGYPDRITAARGLAHILLNLAEDRPPFWGSGQ